MSFKDKLKAKSAGLGAAVDEELAKGVVERIHPRTAVGQASAFQLAISESDKRIAELEAKVRDLESTAIPLSQIEPNPWQPRRVFGEDEIRTLADSIAEVGLIQPIVVRKTVPSRDSFHEDKGGAKSVPTRDTYYQIVAGERRWRAHQLLGHAEIKAVVSDVADADMALMALAENLDREDLTDYETSKAIARVKREFKSKTRLAEAIGIGRQDLYKFEAFFNLPKIVTDDLENEPGLLGRNAAEQVVAAIKIHGQKALDAVSDIWGQVKSGKLDQGKFADALKTAAIHGKHVRTEREIKKLFIGKEQAGSITKDSGTLTIKLRTAALTNDQETRLREFVEGMLKG